MKFTFNLAVAVFAAFLVQMAEAQTSEFLGRWEHRFSGDSEGDIIALRVEHDVLKGDYLGLEREGEHGLFYSATEVKNLEVANGEIRFVVSQRNFFVKRPRNTAQAKAWAYHPSGGSNEDLQFQGHLISGKLELTCNSEYSGCPASHMIFQRRTKPTKVQRTPAGTAEQYR